MAYHLPEVRFHRENRFYETSSLINELNFVSVDGTQSIVQGNYLYYHYTHNNMNDSGWGCAYRSLQTIFSWYKLVPNLMCFFLKSCPSFIIVVRYFRLQGWTDREVPTLPEIQQVLVDIKDKAKSFVGSRQWIGSLEVSFVLDELLNVACRVLNVKKGESLADVAQELANHFRKHGSPVMIGKMKEKNECDEYSALIFWKLLIFLSFRRWSSRPYDIRSRD